MIFVTKKKWDFSEEKWKVAEILEKFTFASWSWVCLMSALQLRKFVKMKFGSRHASYFDLMSFGQIAVKIEEFEVGQSIRGRVKIIENVGFFLKNYVIVGFTHIIQTETAKLLLLGFTWD